MTPPLTPHGPATSRLLAAEAALLASEARFRFLVELSPEAMFVVVGTEAVYANGAAVALSGGTRPEDVTGRPFDQFLEGPYLKRVRERILGERAPAPLHAERFRRVDGFIVDVEVEALPILHEGRPAALVVVHDVTRRYRAEVALAQSEAQLRLVLDQLPAYVWATDDALRVTSTGGGSSTRPHPVADALGETLRQLFEQTDEGSPPLLAHRRALNGAPASFRTEWRDRVFDVRVEPLAQPGKVGLGTVAVALDNTEQVRMEAHLRQRAQVESLARVAGGVAHEMNNVLAAVLGISSARSDAGALDPTIRRDFGRISAAALRGGAIVEGLLGYAGGGLYRREPVDLGKLVRLAAARARRAAPAGVEVTVEVAPDTPDVEGDRAQLEQTVLHLCANAFEATRGPGRIRLTAGREERGPPDGPDGLPAGVYARVEVIDRGVGMTPEVLTRAVEPFFSTRPLGQGVGLGLSMAFGVVRNHEGALSLVSAPGEGTTVTIHLPERCPTSATPTRAPPPPEVAGAAGKSSVLIVDDDPGVREVFESILEGLGYAVRSAEDGPRALELYAARGPVGFSFVLLDMRMPGMDGEEVLRRLVRIDPAVRVILCSGYSRNQIRPELFALGIVGFLGKPFGLAQLRAEIAWVVSAPASGVQA